MASEGRKPEEIYKSGLEAIKKREFSKAVKLFDVLIKNGVMVEQSLTNKGTALASMGRFKEAIKVFEAVVKLSPVNPKGWYNLGNALGRVSRYREAVQCLRRGLELNPGEGKIWFALGVVLGRMGYHDRAMVCYDNVVCLREGRELTASIDEVFGNLSGVSHEEEGGGEMNSLPSDLAGENGVVPEEGKEGVGKVGDTFGGEEKSLGESLGESPLSEKKEHEKKEERDKPSSGSVGSKTREPPGSFQVNDSSFVEKIDKSIENYAGSAKMLLYKAYQHLKKNEPGEALDLFEKVIASHPNEIAAYEGLGKVYASLGDHEKAMEQFKKVVELQMKKGRL